jgi:ABC-type multidrug transport system ATPase subunit
MGVSGAGKTTLLDVLATRVTMGVAVDVVKNATFLFLDLDIVTHVLPLEDSSLSLDCTALMGVSGAGKTTLLDVLATRVTMGVVSGEMLVTQPSTWSRMRRSSFLIWIS